MILINWLMVDWFCHFKVNNVILTKSLSSIIMHGYNSHRFLIKNSTSLHYQGYS